MKKLILLFASIFILSASSIAQQNISVVGKTVDTFANKNIIYASVSLLNRLDSTLVKSTRSNAKGEFELKNINLGKYILLLSHPNYATYVDELELKADKQNVNLGDVNMFERAHMIKEVIIKNKAAIIVRGDTLEYLADSFKVRKGAVVEDLLKVLPGIQVNKNGEITAQGETVQKVLVDGEEFFGDDPTVATQNLQSKIVDKVQVFDKKSDQAQFTGFDDGETTKTINLKLKEDMNKGWFGKAQLGAGANDRWENQGMINNFLGKRQISAYGIMSSNGTTGLSWEDRQKYGSGNNMSFMDEDGGISMTFFTDDDEDGDGGMNFFGRGQAGITKAWNGGARYANKWEDGKHHLNLNYSTGLTNTYKKQIDLTETILPNGSIFRQDTSENFSSRNIHKVSASYDWQIDSTLTIQFKSNSKMRFLETNSELSTINKTASELPISKNNRNNNTNSRLTQVNNQVTFNKKLKKKGRTISLSANHINNDKNGLGSLLGNNSTGINSIQINSILDQEKVQDSKANSIVTSVTYTEPLTEKLLLKVGYDLNYDNSHLSTTVSDTVGYSSGNYFNQIDSLSNIFDLNVTTHIGRAELKYVQKKYNIAIGTGVGRTFFHQDDLIRNKNYDYTRTNLFPTLRFNYKFSQFKRISFSYSGRTKNPTPDQIQPVQNNNNPLEIYEGNPNLTLGYNQNINMNYFSYQALSGKSVYAGIFLNNGLKQIGLNRVFESTGRTVNKYINLSSPSYSSNIWGGYDSKIGTSDWNFGINLNGGFSVNPNIINNEENKTYNTNLGFSPSIRYNKEDKFNFRINGDITYNISKTTLRNGRNIEYLSYSPSADFTYYLPAGFEFNTDINYEFRPAVSPYPTDFKRTIWNASVSRRVLPKQNLELRFAINDILNQNIGYERSTSNNYNTEQFYNTLQRYWMVSAVWNFFSGPMAETASGYDPGKKKGGGRRHGGRRHH